MISVDFVVAILEFQCATRIFPPPVAAVECAVPVIARVPRPFLSYVHKLKIGLSLFLLAVMKRHESAVARPLAGLAETSFGIFFVHAYCLRAVWAGAERLGIDLEGRGALTWLLLTVAIAAVSFGVVRVTQRLFGSRSRMLIGS